jgi:hypothetical protein
LKNYYLIWKKDIDILSEGTIRSFIKSKIKLFITDVFDTLQDPESIKRNSDLGINLNEPID